MPSTTDFSTWLDENEPETFEEAHSLHQALSGESSGLYDVQTNERGQMFISRSGGETTLALVSSAAIHAFAKRIATYNSHPELDWEGAAALVRALAKDD